MIQIRKSVFETNSSSTHSICISKDHVEPKDRIDFHIGYYEWENDKVNAADYLYTAILCAGSNETWKDDVDKLKSFLDKNNVEYSFEEPVWYHSDWGDTYLENGTIDHSHETIPFIHAALGDEDILARTLFGDSYVYTGNDNIDEVNPKCYAACPTYWEDYKNENGDWDSRELSNPNHDEEHYEYFVKGN